MKFFTALLFGLLLCMSVQGKATKANEKRVVCYFSSWAGYRNGLGAFTPEDTDATICTHAIYAFAGLDQSNGHIIPLDAWNDLSTGGGKGFYNRFVALKKKNPKLKVLLGVGGWNEGSSKYSVMASSKTGRSRFISSSIELLKEHHFDGLDLAWMYPGSRGGSISDRKSYALLIEEMRAAYDKENLILTGTLPALEAFVDAGYDMDAVSKYLEFINILSYDYRGSWDGRSGLGAPLHFQDLTSNIPDVADTMNVYLSKGVPSNKIVMGIPTHAQTYTLANPDEADLNVATTGPGGAGKYTQQPGFLGYNEIAEEFYQNPTDWSVQRDKESGAPFASNYLLWISYDDQQSVKDKAAFINKNNLGGAMVFTIDTDDFRGTGDSVTFPIVRTLHEELIG